MSIGENKAIVSRFYEAVLSEHRVEQANEYAASDYVDHDPAPQQAPCLDGAKQKWAVLSPAMR
jgi:predicted SnoaL-like aldol condensation-catalyzing enzyme